MLRRAYSTAAASSSLLKTPLYDLHVKLGADIVDFAGYAMPVLYKGQTHIESHNWVRSHAGLFDVSHMLQQNLSGDDVIPFLDKITPSDFKSLKPWTNQLSVLLNKEGGIVDDTIITKHDDDKHFYIVTNAGTREGDLAFFKEEAKAFDVKFDIIDNALIALQGPTAAKVLQHFTNEDLSKIYFGNSKFIKIPGFNNEEIHLARGGYTGEDGFELSIPNKISVDFTQELLGNEEVKPIGLAARDSLRLEAEIQMFLNSMDSSKILAQLADRSLVKQQRIGFTSKGPAAREGAEIFSAEEPEKKIGIVTSGSPSPSLPGRVNIGQAYIDRGYHKSGTPILIQIRNKKKEATVSKQPFVAPKYYRA
ncbi:unnamed protein product [Wickerhamomyces anomalus]